ncbi:LacI family DNA-binding transcriptional regulator [Rhodococcus sp. BP-241]|uniref:LacI family DNA-binding transcriptional regulator n=1 Tax=Rhodococcus sp. BP-241 TaxID=2739441 RepID=UPI001C9AEFA5|nr:LacI family DNA-binding transcriptional regulator [Rhodococcus sp. BP-241]MBY6706290.1 LacI family DNA-binding transcriptional regulator [Rhodococcus sp. BP-241]
MSVEEVPPKRRGRSATLRDVASLAGVSIATASKALNNRRHVGAETRVRVQSAADQLDFSPNALAQGMVAQRSGTVGLITSDLVGRFSIPVLRGAEDAFGSERMSVLLCDAREDRIREQHHLRALMSRRVDGLIVVGARPDPRPSLGKELDVPVVYAYAPSDDPTDMSVVADDFAGGRLAMDHLLVCGRRRIAHITGDPGYGATQERARGASERLQEEGLQLAGGAVMFGEWSEAWGRGATRLLLERQPDLDAVFAGSDQIARGVLDALIEAGRRVPEEVAVIGFDNWEVLATGSRPPLTTVDPSLENIGRAAAMRLAAAIEGHVGSGIEVEPCRLVTRSSTAPLH